MLSLVERAQRRFPDRPGFKVTETLIENLKEERAGSRSSNVARLAAKYGVPAALVRYVVDELPNPDTKFTSHSDDGWGRKDLRPFIVTRREANGVWSDEQDALIAPQRVAYDEGRVEMVQGRDGDFIIQYAIPRRKPAKRPVKYFEFGEEFED